MAFKGVATASGSNLTNKVYMWRAISLGAGIGCWIYVSADAATTVDGSNYITDTAFIDVILKGDWILAYQVASIDDTRDIQADFNAGISDLSWHLVLDNTGTVIDLSDDILGATVTYGD